MGKKAAPKKAIVFCTTSVKGKKDIEREAEEAKEAAEEAARKAEEAEAASAAASSAAAAAPADTVVSAPEEEVEEWERFGEEERTPIPQASSAAGEDDEEAVDEEEWEMAVESRLKDELAKLERKVIPADAASQFERRGGYAPAGVVVLSKTAEQKVDAALAPLRDAEGELKPCLPRHWRFKGKLTWERINAIYSSLEALNFKGDQIRLAMGKTGGYDARAALEWLLLNLPKQELPRQFGGESLGDDPTSAQEEDEGAVGPGSDLVEAPFGPAELQPDPKEEAAMELERFQKSRARGDAASVCSTATPNETEPGDSDDESPELRTPKAEEKPETAPVCDREAGKDFARRWLEQYEEADEDEHALLSPEEILERERKKDPTARYIKVSAQYEEAAKTLKALKEKRRRGAFKQNISADQMKQRDASNKLLSCKSEMELLESGKYGALDQERVNQARPKRAPPKEEEPKEPAKAAPEPAGEAKEEEAEDPELPALFEGDGADAAGSEATSKTVAVRSYGLGSWTGRTPKEAFEDFVKKKYWGGKHNGACGKYQKIPCGGGLFRSRLVVQLPRLKRRRFDPEEPCQNVKEAEHLAATLALMKLCEESDRTGLQRGLPPAYRQRWQEWEQKNLDDMREKKKNLVKDKIVFLERLLRTKHSALSANLSSGSEGNQTSSGRLPGEDELALQEMSGEAAARLRESYADRQTSLSQDKEFDELQQIRQRLPVAEYREQFLRSVARSPVVVVSGATGSGKTTQVPQYVLEHALEGPPEAPLPQIIVTEPRRISAVSVAKRVSQEIGDPPGGPGSRDSLVGYQIRLEKKVSSSTRLLFCTVGVLLRQLQQGLGALAKVTHIFIDEVHERSADCDLLMLLLRQVRGSRPDLCLVLMSATMESEKLVRYFGSPSSVPVLSIPGRTFPVQQFWLEDAVQMTGYRCEEESEFAKKSWNRGWNTEKKTFQVSGDKGKTQTLTAYIDEEEEWGCDDEAEMCDPDVYEAETMRALSYMDHSRINYDLIELLLEYIEGSDQFSGVVRHEGAILVFLPGMMEITKMHERLRSNSLFSDPSTCLVLTLHSMLSGEDHAKVFDPPRPGVRKIVLSTNIAETGVTIPDVVFVVDAGKVKCQRYHEPSNTSSLKEQFISKAEVLQRRGRAGRVRAGFGFTLLTKSRFNMRLQEMPTPEILRCSLMELMLSVLSSGLQPNSFTEALDPPAKSRIDQAVTTLRSTGAVEEGVRPPDAPRWSRDEDDAWYVITPVGQCLVRLPCDVRLGKMVLYAALFGGVEAVWTVAATLSHRSPLASPFSESKRAQAKATHCAELLPKAGPPSDHLALNTAYAKWEDARKNRGVESFCRKSWLNNQVLQTIRDIRNDFLESLRGDGFVQTFSQSEIPKQDLTSVHMVSALLLAGLYPNVARLDPPKSATDKFPLLSAGSEQLKLHPGSLCHGKIEGLHRTNHRWICYHTKMKTSQVFLRDSTFLPPNALLLFGGEANSLSIHPMEKVVSVGTGGEKHWHTLNIAPRAAAHIRQLRHAFDGMLRRKASRPKAQLSESDRAVLAAYVAVINSVDTDS